MAVDRFKNSLRFYFITDDSAPALSTVDQVKIALQAGATIIQYRHKSFSPRVFDEVTTIRDMCKCNAVPFIINGDILLAKAVMADGVHLDQKAEEAALARHILGTEAIVGISVSTLDEFNYTDLSNCDYIGTGPVFSTTTKADAKKVIGLSGLKIITDKSPVPVVAIGGIDHTNAEACFTHGASGVAIISAITRADQPDENTLRIGSALGSSPRLTLNSPWDDEFDLIKKLLVHAPTESRRGQALKIPPGDDACLMESIKNPVFTTDTQKEGVHFRLDWQTPKEIGKKAVEVAFSDLAACYADPVSLFINLTLPAHISEKTVDEFYQGINNSLREHDCTMGGGNISAGTQLSLDLFAVGNGRDDIFPTRSAALPGFGLYCTGPLGLARAGLICLVNKDAAFQELVAKFTSPSARFDAAHILTKHRVPCVIDVSDGLAGDAHHIAEASGISIELDVTSSFFDPALVSFCEKYNQKPEDIALVGGEDYELLFACSEDTFENIKKDLPEVFQVGRCLVFQGMYLVNMPSGVSSYQHGKR